MTREQQKQLKAIDDQILRHALTLQNLLRDRAAIDLDSTQRFFQAFVTTLELSIEQKEDTSAHEKTAPRK